LESIDKALDAIAKGQRTRLCYLQGDRDSVNRFGVLGKSSDGLGLDIWDVDVSHDSSFSWPQDSWWPLDQNIGDLKKEFALRRTQLITASALGHWAPFLGVMRFKFMEPRNVGIHDLHLAFSPHFLSQVLNRWAEINQVLDCNFSPSDSLVLGVTEQLAKEKLAISVVPSNSTLLSFANAPSSYLATVRALSSSNRGLLHLTNLGDIEYTHLVDRFLRVVWNDQNGRAFRFLPGILQAKQTAEKARDSRFVSDFCTLNDKRKVPYALVLAPLRARNLIEIH
jgi:hypothetical protein